MTDVQPSHVPASTIARQRPRPGRGARPGVPAGATVRRRRPRVRRPDRRAPASRCSRPRSGELLTPTAPLAERGRRVRRRCSSPSPASTAPRRGEAAVHGAHGAPDTPRGRRAGARALAVAGRRPRRLVRRAGPPTTAAHRRRRRAARLRARLRRCRCGRHAAQRAAAAPAFGAAAAFAAVHEPGVHLAARGRRRCAPAAAGRRRRRRPRPGPRRRRGAQRLDRQPACSSSPCCAVPPLLGWDARVAWALLVLAGRCWRRASRPRSPSTCPTRRCSTSTGSPSPPGRPATAGAQGRRGRIVVAGRRDASAWSPAPRASSPPPRPRSW